MFFSLKKTSKRGFTLIELLVVIAIIGLLSSIVLASLSSARDRAADASVKSNLATVQTQAEIYFNNNDGSYGSAIVAHSYPSANSYNCGSVTGGVFADPVVNSAIAQALSAIDPTATPACAIGVGGQSWAVSVPLKNNGVWCVSSAGAGVNKYASHGGILVADCKGFVAPSDSPIGNPGGGDNQ